MSLLVKAIYLITCFYLSNFIIKAAQADIVVVAYDNFSNKGFDLEVIDKHIKLLNNKKYYVLSTNTIIDAISSTKILPNYSVAITITSNKKQIINANARCMPRAGTSIRTPILKMYGKAVVACMVEDEEIISNCAIQNNLIQLKKLKKENWLCLAFIKK